MGWRTPQSGRGHPQACGAGSASVLPPPLTSSACGEAHSHDQAHSRDQGKRSQHTFRISLIDRNRHAVHDQQTHGRRCRDTDRGHAGDPDDGKVPYPVALLPVRPTNRMVRMVANPAQANGQIPVVSRPSTEKAPRTSSALLHPHPMAGGRPHRPPPGGRPQGTRSAGCRTNPRLSPPP